MWVRDKVTGVVNNIHIEGEIPEFILGQFEILDSYPEPEEELPEMTLKRAKEEKRNEIIGRFQASFGEGFFSQTLGVVIDCRKIPYQNEEDIENIERLIAYMEDSGQTTTYYRDSYNDNIPNVTVDMLRNVVKEMRAYGVSLYMKKHWLLDEISSAQTIEEVNAITW